MKRVVCLCLSVFAFACAPAENAPPSACAVPPVIDSTFDLVDGAIDPPQIHLAAAFDGEALWLVYNLPDAGGGFDVWAQRRHCDGSIATAPFRVNTTTAGNDVDPAIAIGDGNLYITWHSDDGSGGPDNLDVFFRSFRSTGAALMETDRILETTRNGGIVSSNHWMPSVTALPGGAFAIAASRANQTLTAFHAFVQIIAADGTLLGEALDLGETENASESNPTVVATADGGLYVAWTRSEANGDVVRHGRIARGGDSWDVEPVDAWTGASSSASYALDAVTERTLLAFTAVDGGEYSIRVKDGASFGAATPTLEIGAPGRLDHTPTVVSAADGGVVAWYRNIAGFQNELHVQRFYGSGQGLTAGDTAQIPTDAPAAPYAPALERVTDDVYFVGWSQGQSPALRLKGRFVQLP